MCGISGYVTDRLAPEVVARIVGDMNNGQKHRGPDGEGIWSDRLACLGHRRLAIIDLSEAGAQPMTNEDRTLVLVCNGEIYNFNELRTDLVSRGHRFRSRTDVEVILHLYEEHGVDCVRHLVGMFAFALWDAARRRLLLARDRIGEKPLHYAETSHGLAFASEIAPLLNVPGVNTTLDDEGMVASLVYASCPAPLTMFAGVRALPPASRLTYDAGAVRLERYWAIDCSAPGVGNIEESEAVEQLDVLVHRAVRGALLSDVPVGVLLSGGVDSGAIAAHASRAGASVRAFSIAHDSRERPDPDLARAREISTRLKLPHLEIPFGAVDLERLPWIIERYAQPFNLFPMLYADQLASSVRRHVAVALGGNGADEAFGGYRGYNRQLMVDRIGVLLARTPKWAAGIVPIGCERIRRALSAAGEPIENRRARFLDELARQLGAALLTPEFASRAYDSSPGHFVAEYARECGPRDYLDTVMYSDLMVYHQHSTTVLPDMSGMTHSLEIRAPFLDHRVLEFMFALPNQLKIRSALRPNRNKYVLKRSLETVLPTDVLYGRKYGFGYNISYPSLLRREWRSAVDAFVRRGRYLELGIFSHRGAEWAIEHAPSETWRLLVFAIWAELFLFGGRADQIANELQVAVSAAPRAVA